MESHQNCKPDLHFRSLLALFFSASWISSSFFLQPDFPRAVAGLELSPGHMVSFSHSLSLWPGKGCRVATDS